MEHWDNIRHFLAIVRAGTRQAAANDLGVAQIRAFVDFMYTALREDPRLVPASEKN